MARLVVTTCMLACWLSPGSARADRIAGKPDLAAVSGYYGWAVAVGKRGAVFVYNKRKKTWKRKPLSEKSALVGVHMANRSDIWALAKNGRVLRLHRGNWSLIPGVDKGRYRGLAMARWRRGVVVGSGGAVYHLVRERWSKFFASPLETDLFAVARVGYGGGGERFVAVGRGGTVLALGGVGRSLTSDIEISQSKQDLVAITACHGYRAEAVAVGRDVVVRAQRDGTWRKLSSGPGALTAVTVRCRRRRARTVYATMGTSIVWLDVRTGTWYNHAVHGISTLRALTWLDRRRLIAVGDAGSVVIVAVKQLDKEAAGIAQKAATKLHFPRFPGATKVCDGRVYSRSTRKHISWQRYATTDTRAHVRAFFKAKLGASHLSAHRRSDTWRYPLKHPVKVLSIATVKAAPRHRDCKPPAGSQTIIEYSQLPR